MMPTPITVARYVQGTTNILGLHMTDPVGSLPLAIMGFQHIGGDALTTELPCFHCSGLTLPLQLHAADRYVAALQSYFGGKSVLACGTAGAFAE